jgi:uncharacterized cupin superfamily protein
MEVATVALTDQFSHVIEGEVAVETDDGTVRLGPGDTIYVRTGRRIRIHNDGEQPARLLGCGIGSAAALPPVA